MKAIIFLLSTSLLGAYAHAEAHQHGAHEHGHGELNVVIEGNQLMIELQAPAADLVGFEHAPQNDQQTAQYQQALAKLRQPERLFALAKKAACQAAEPIVNNQPPAHDEHDDHHDHKGHDEHDKPHMAAHSDVSAIYHYRCQQIDKLNELTLSLFSVYPSLAKLSVQAIVANQQTAAELTPAANTLRW